MTKLTLNLVAPLTLEGGTVSLLPGENHVSPDAWAKVKDAPITQHYLKTGALVAETPKPEPGKDGKGK